MPSRPIYPTQKTNPNTRSGFILAIIILSTVIFLLTVLYLIYYLWDTLFRRSRTNPFDSLSDTLKLQKFSYKELKSASNKFSDDNLIGKGGSGTVFRGILKNGNSVAIKRLDADSSLQAEREFQSELTVLGNVKSLHIVTLLGYCVKKNKRLLVYEYMPNHSLQERLFSDGNCMDWEKRFRVVMDVAKALEYLHNECDPPVIHGDVKPSNVLLDWEFKGKLSDFGLSRVKVEDEIGIDMFSQELSGNLNGEIDGECSGGEVDFALALQASKSRGLQGSPKGKEVLVEDELISSVENSKELDLNPTVLAEDVGCVKQWGKDWWWKQDDSGVLCSKEYVNEWIGTQVGSPMSANLDGSPQLNQLKDGKGEETRTKRNSPKSKPRKMQDWWKEEQLDEEEMNKKNTKRKTLRSKMKKTIKTPHLRLSRRFYTLKKRISRASNHLDNDELNHREYKRNMGSIGSEMSGELFSRELSSTTSMRGTLCYVAPEYGGYGYLMEKGDIYSLGVLILVIVSGRRPLHVLNSPMKLEKANLVSWCRNLAQAGNVLELVDERLKDEYDRQKVMLCIHLALACLQRVPELRPDIGDVVRVLRGEMELPLLPFEFSPSPPSKLYSRSRRKDGE